MILFTEKNWCEQQGPRLIESGVFEFKCLDRVAMICLGCLEFACHHTSRRRPPISDICCTLILPPESPEVILIFVSQITDWLTNWRNNNIRTYRSTSQTKGGKQWYNCNEMYISQHVLVLQLAVCWLVFRFYPLSLNWI